MPIPTQIALLTLQTARFNPFQKDLSNRLNSDKIFSVCEYLESLSSNGT